MADESTKSPVVDSRYKGFDPEVEAAHPDVEKPEVPQPEAPPPPPPPPPPKRAPLAVVADALALIVDHLGNAPKFDAIMQELSDLL